MGKKIYKEIDLRGLPRKGSKIDWKNSIGCKCKFVYDDIEGEIEIVGYESTDDTYITFKYNDKISKMKSTDLRRCLIGKVLNKRTSEFKVEIGTIFKDNKRNLIITDKKHKERGGIIYKYYKYKCLTCGYYEGWIVESSLTSSGTGCSCCSGDTIVEGINDIPTTAPWMVKYFQGGYKEAKKYTYSSSKTIYPICPDCGRVKNRKTSIYNLYKNHSIACGCEDGKSYPNKFIYNLLIQLSIDFIDEYSPLWLNGRKFDFYIPSKNLIIEMDGALGHGNEYKIGKITPEESKRIDDWKDEQAQINGLNVIRINCNYGNNTLRRFNYIKTNILNSKFVQFYDCDNINWAIIEEFCEKNFIKSICEYYELNKFTLSMSEMCNALNINKSVISLYLKKGNKFGWCDYSPILSMKNIGKFYKPHNCKKVLCLELNEEFESATDCARQLKKRFNKNFLQSSISDVCNEKRNTHQGFTFKYV